MKNLLFAIVVVTRQIWENMNSFNYEKRSKNGRICDDKCKTNNTLISTESRVAVTLEGNIQVDPSFLRFRRHQTAVSIPFCYRFPALLFPRLFPRLKFVLTRLKNTTPTHELFGVFFFYFASPFCLSPLAVSRLSRETFSSCIFL